MKWTCDERKKKIQNVWLKIRIDEKDLSPIRTFIEHQIQCVFKGSKPRKSYTSSDIKQRLVVEDASLKLADLTLSSNPQAIDFKNIVSSRINLKDENDLIQILLNLEMSKTGFLLEF